jgi:hypothetical protein
MRKRLQQIGRKVSMQAIFRRMRGLEGYFFIKHQKTLISFKKCKVKEISAAVDEQNKTFAMVTLSSLSNVAGRYLEI